MDNDKLFERLQKANPKIDLKIGDDDVFNYERISFGVPKLDKLVGGGIPKKRFSMLYGATNVGKSFLASQLVANVQKDGGTAVWIDTEQSFDPIWNEKNGVDTSKIIVLQPANGEEGLNLASSALQEGVDIVVIDSFAGLVPASVQDEEFGYNPMAWQARFLNSALPKLLTHLKHGSALVAINQLRSNVGRVTYNNMPGGIGQQFYTHLQLEVRRSAWIEEDKKKIGFEMEVRLKKTKQGGDDWDSIILPYKVGGGIDLIEVTINEALEKGLIKQSGAWYSYKEERIQGKNRVRQYFVDNPNMYEQLTKEVNDDLLS
tara:strand:- start:12 stop:962 length:951 start_codon:yes stop_codon:yes gene_type:complete